MTPGTRGWILRQQIALGLLILVAVAYPISWNLDPYVFGFTVLGLMPFQFGLAAIGVIGRILRREPPWLHNAIAWLVDVLLAGSAAWALAFLRSISWS